jgi:hypothetical protein
LKAIYASIAEGPTKQSIQNAVAILSGVDSSQIYELYDSQQVTDLKSKHGNSILGSWDGTDLTHKFAVEVPWSSFDFSKGDTRIKRFLDAIKPSHTLYLLVYPLTGDYSDGIKLADTLTVLAAAPERRADHALADFSQVG